MATLLLSPQLVLLSVLASGAAGSVLPCNHSQELGPGTWVQLLAPARDTWPPGRPLECRYTLALEGDQVQVLRLTVARFRVGSLTNTGCVGGSLQILDSAYEAVNQELGHHCGEAEQPKLIVRETESMELVFRVDGDAEGSQYTEWDIRVEAVTRAEVPERYGSHAGQFPGRVGAVVEGSYCETVFQECRAQQCHVQSPGFPGVYPRGVSCRYYISTKKSLIKLYVDKQASPYWEAFNVEGRRCENLLECEVKELTSSAAQCPGDHVSLYDGVDEYSELIGRWCGVGSFPVSIIGSSNKLFLEFVSTKHGPLLNTGFDFRVTSLPGLGSRAENGSCDLVVEGGEGEGSLISLEHWHPPGTRCTTTLRGRDHQVVRLHFEKMRISSRTPIKEPEDECGDSLVLYDADWADPQRILKAFCSRFSAARENTDYVTTGPSMFISFLSPSGSYSGSSIYYWAIYDFHDARVSGVPVAGTACDEVLSGGEGGTLRSPRNSLVFRHAPASRPLVCRYSIRAEDSLYSRIALTLDKLNFKAGEKKCPKKCWSHSGLDRLEVVDPLSSTNTTTACVSACTRAQLRPIVSLGPRLDVKLIIDQNQAQLNYYKTSDPIFTGEYRYLHPPVCGQTRVEATQEGSLTFPALAHPEVQPAEAVECLWDLRVKPSKQLNIMVSNVTFPRDSCADHSVELSVPSQQVSLYKECGKLGKLKKNFDVKGKDLKLGVVQIHVKMKNIKSGSFTLNWS